MRAAQYLRMSTDHQQYSIENQKAAIAEYALQHGLEVVRTYADPAKSGLDIKNRPGLQNLLNEVLGGAADFEAVLVYDVSRWGRFQDSDEAACYEFLCKRAKIRVCYCAEPFENDGSVLSSITKMIKRTMAAEYVRDLSKRVHAGQCRIASQGFWLGGSPGLGYRRVLLDSKGAVKRVLEKGEYKQLATDRTSVTLGPRSEVRLVRQIFSMYVEQHLGVRTIVRVLNEAQAGSKGWKQLNQLQLQRLLENPRYTGCLTYNRHSQKLRTKSVTNPRSEWIVVPNAFPAIISSEMFKRAEERRKSLVLNRSNERLLAELRAYIEEHGTGIPSGRKIGDMPSARTLQSRFGSLAKAYEAVGFTSKYHSRGTDETVQKIRRLRVELSRELEVELVRIGITVSCGPCQKLVGFNPDCRTLHLLIGRYQKNRNHRCWDVPLSRLRGPSWPIVARLSESNNSVLDFIYFPQYLFAKHEFGFDEQNAKLLGVPYRNLREVAVSYLLSCGRFPEMTVD